MYLLMEKRSLRLTSSVDRNSVTEVFKSIMLRSILQGSKYNWETLSKVFATPFIQITPYINFQEFVAVGFTNPLRAHAFELCPSSLKRLLHCHVRNDFNYKTLLCSGEDISKITSGIQMITKAYCMLFNYQFIVFYTVM